MIHSGLLDMSSIANLQTSAMLAVHLPPKISLHVSREREVHLKLWYACGTLFWTGRVTNISVYILRGTLSLAISSPPVRFHESLVVPHREGLTSPLKRYYRESFCVPKSCRLRFVHSWLQVALTTLKKKAASPVCDIILVFVRVTKRTAALIVRSHGVVHSSRCLPPNRLDLPSN